MCFLWRDPKDSARLGTVVLPWDEPSFRTIKYHYPGDAKAVSLLIFRLLLYCSLTSSWSWNIGEVGERPRARRFFWKSSGRCKRYKGGAYPKHMPGGAVIPAIDEIGAMTQIIYMSNDKQTKIKPYLYPFYRLHVIILRPNYLLLLFVLCFFWEKVCL